jgi:hypothetical protein
MLDPSPSPRYCPAMSEEDVNDAIIKPMCRLYPPPRHLRGDEDILDAALGTYRRALARFDQKVLEAAWDRVVAQNAIWCWPKVADIVQAAEAVKGASRPELSEDWVERATRMADSYTRRYMQTTQAAVRARESGFEAALKRYIWEASWVQSQMICGRGGVGYDHAVLFPARERDKEAEAEFFAKAREIAKSGHIRVSVPRGLIEQWTEKAESQDRAR